MKKMGHFGRATTPLTVDARLRPMGVFLGQRECFSWHLETRRGPSLSLPVRGGRRGDGEVRGGFASIHAEVCMARISGHGVYADIPGIRVHERTVLALRGRDESFPVTPITLAGQGVRGGRGSECGLGTFPCQTRCGSSPLLHFFSTSSDQEGRTFLIRDVYFSVSAMVRYKPIWS